MQIYSYLFRGIAKSCFGIAGGLILIMLTVQIIAQNDLLIRGTVSFLQLVLISLLSVIEFVPFLLIIGFVASVRLNCLRLSNDHEWVILQATGYAYRQVLYPFYIMLGGIMLLCYCFSLLLIPEALYVNKQKLHDYKNQAFRSQLITGRFYEPDENLILHIGRSEPANAQLHDVYMLDNRTSPGYFLNAKQGKFWQTQQGLKIQFFSGSYYYLRQDEEEKRKSRKNRQEKLHHVDFKELWVDVSGFSDGDTEQDEQKIIRDKIKILQTFTLLSFLRKKSTDDAIYNPDLHLDYLQELQQRFNLPLLAASLTGFLLCLPMHAIARQKRSVFARFGEFYGIVFASISLILLQILLVNSRGIEFFTLSYLFPLLMLLLPFLRGRK